MALSAHKITARQVRALADGTSTAADLNILAAGQRSKFLAMLALVVRMATEARHPEAAAAAAGWRLLARVQRQAPRAVEDLLRYPSVGAWATTAVLTLTSLSCGDSVPPGRLALIAAAAAIRGGVPCTVELPASMCAGPTLHLPSLGSVLLPSQLCGKPAVFRHHDKTSEISGEHAKVVLPRRLETGERNWRPLPAVALGSGRMAFRLIIDDADPCRLAAHGTQLDRLTFSQLDEWQRRISGGWHLLTLRHRRTATDVRSLIRTVTPVTGTGGAMSVTSRQVFGSIGLSLPDDDVAMALTLSHEVQHAKLSALMDLLPILTEPAPGLYYAPWRPDPRPLASLLQGMYAHLGVARFWHRHRKVVLEPAEVHHAYVEFARWRSACAQVAEVVSTRPELTRCGSAFVGGMVRLLDTLRSEYVPPEAQVQANQAVSEHQRQWETRLHGRTGTSPAVRRLTQPESSAKLAKRRQELGGEAVAGHEGGRRPG